MEREKRSQHHFNVTNISRSLQALDDCLLDDDEFSLGLDGWKATMGDMFLFDEARNNGSDSDEEDAMED